MLKKVLIGSVVFCIAIVLIGFTLPTTFHVEHEEHIVASNKMIFVFLGDLPRWKEWTIWAKKDPQTEYEYSNPTYGVGAWQKWNSKSMGHGTIIITEWSLENSVAYDMQIEGWTPSKARMQMSPAKTQGAMVKWTMDGTVPSNPIMRYCGLLMRWFIKNDFRKSLAELKKLAENSVSAEVNGPWHKPREEAPKPAAPPVRVPKTKNP